jgi:hypothetical protein
MHQFRTTLVSGRKRPYQSWTFLVIPASVAKNWGPSQKAVRVSICGHTLRGTASRGEGLMRVPIPRDFREIAGVGCGDAVDVGIELDLSPRPLSVPAELQAALRGDLELSALYETLPVSMRRAWAVYVEQAKRPETRMRRAQQAADGIRGRAYPR